MTTAPYVALAVAVLAGALGWWRAARLRHDLATLRTIHTRAAVRHKQDLDEADIRHETEYADMERSRDECLAGWHLEWTRRHNLQDRLAAEQRRLDAADRDRAGLRGVIADLQRDLEDYAHAWGEVPHAWRTPVDRLTDEAKGDVWAPQLVPSPVLLGLLADPTAPRLPDEWVSVPFRWEPPATPVKPRAVRAKRKASKAVAR